MANITTLDLGPVRQVYKGEYSPAVPYDLLNTVFYQGESWVMIKTPYVAGSTPSIDSPYWQKIAVKGLNGKDGKNGTDGKDGDVSTLIPKTGDRGVLSGYENGVESSGAPITINSPDTMFVQTNGNYPLNFTKAGVLNQTSTKVIILSAVTTTTLSIAGAEWANNADAPTWGTKDSILVLVAHFFGDYVYLSVFHNSEG